MAAESSSEKTNQTNRHTWTIITTAAVGGQEADRHLARETETADVLRARSDDG